MVAHDVLDDARHTHAPSSKDADYTVKAVSHLGTDEDWLAVVNLWNLEKGLLILLQCRLALLATDALLWIRQLCANLLIPNDLRSNLSYSLLVALELYVKRVNH